MWYTKVVTFRSDKLEENEQGELTVTKKYSEECQFTKPQTSPSFSENAKEIHELQKRIHELEKENLFLKKAAAFFAKEID